MKIMIGIVVGCLGCSSMPKRTRSSDPVMRIAIDADTLSESSYARLLQAIMDTGKFIVVDRSSGFKAIVQEQEHQHGTTRFGAHEKYALWGSLYGVGGIFVGTEECMLRDPFIGSKYYECLQNLTLINTTTGEVMAASEALSESETRRAASWDDAIDTLVDHYPKRFVVKEDLHQTVKYDETLIDYRENVIPSHSKPVLGIGPYDSIPLAK